MSGKPKKKFTVPLDRTTLLKMKKKNRLWGKIRKDLAYEEEKLKYKRLSNQIRRLTRKGKKIFERMVAKNSKSNPKVFWKYAQSKLKGNRNIPDIIKNDDKDNPIYATSDKDKSEVFLKYFSSVFTEEPLIDSMPHFDKREYL